MLENLGKTVIVTGSQVKNSKPRLLMHFSLFGTFLVYQIPCFETRNDGLDNIIGALILAGENIPFLAKNTKLRLN